MGNTRAAKQNENATQYNQHTKGTWSLIVLLEKNDIHFATLPTSVRFFQRAIIRILNTIRIPIIPKMINISEVVQYGERLFCL